MARTHTLCFASADVLIPSLSRVVERRRVCVVELAIGPFSILMFYTLCLLLRQLISTFLPFIMASAATSPETEVAIAMRRAMQAEANAALAEARVLQQWNMVQAIVAKPPEQRSVEELENAQAALDFAKAAYARAATACTHLAAEVAEAKAAAQVESTSSAAAARTLAASSKRRTAADNVREPGDLDNDDDDECEPLEKRPKSYLSSSSPAFSSPCSSSSLSSDAAVARKAHVQATQEVNLSLPPSISKSLFSLFSHDSTH